MTRYEYIVVKYYKTCVDKSYYDFVKRNPAPIGSSRTIIDSLILGLNNSAIITIVVISTISLAALGEYFFIRKRKVLYNLNNRI